MKLVAVFQDDHIADAEAVAAKVFRRKQIELGIEAIQDRRCLLCAEVRQGSKVA